MEAIKILDRTIAFVRDFRGLATITVLGPLILLMNTWRNYVSGYSTSFKNGFGFGSRD